MGKHLRQEKRDFVISYLIKHPPMVDVMNRDFVEKYIEEFQPPYKPTMYGADRCPQLGKLLKEMYDMRLLQRKRTGITCGYSGYPKWVYCYELLNRIDAVKASVATGDDSSTVR